MLLIRGGDNYGYYSKIVYEAPKKAQRFIGHERQPSQPQKTIYESLFNLREWERVDVNIIIVGEVRRLSSLEIMAGEISPVTWNKWFHVILSGHHGTNNM